MLTYLLAFCFQTITVDQGQPALVNGFIAQEEWADAQSVTFGPFQIRAKTCGPYLYLAIWEPQVIHTGIDLYVAEESAPLRKFHVSSALCTAIQSEEDHWTESWENNRAWVANKIGLFQLDGARQTSQPEAFEFQFERSLFPSNQIHVAFHLKRPEVLWPADRSQMEQWIVLQLAANPQD